MGVNSGRLEAAPSACASVVHPVANLGAQWYPRQVECKPCLRIRPHGSRQVWAQSFGKGRQTQALLAILRRSLTLDLCWRHAAHGAPDGISLHWRDTLASTKHPTSKRK